MDYTQFRRFMWFPLLRRFLWAWSAFKYAWKHVHPTRHWADGYAVWLCDNQPFKVGDFNYIKGDKPYPKSMLPNGIEPFMLKKRCVDMEGNVRFFDVIPEGYERVDLTDNWETFGGKSYRCS